MNCKLCDDPTKYPMVMDSPAGLINVCTQCKFKLVKPTSQRAMMLKAGNVLNLIRKTIRRMDAAMFRGKADEWNAHNKRLQELRNK